MRVYINKISRWVFTLCFVSLLSACGFSLRGSQTLPTSLTQVVINAPLQYSPLSRALSDRLPVYQLTSIVNPATNISQEQIEQTVFIQLQPEQFERRLLSVFSTGQVAEYELVFTVNYQVSFPNKQPIKNALTVAREYQDDPDQILAKSRELNLIFNELRSEAADRMIRLLSSQYNSAINYTEADKASNKLKKRLHLKGD